MEGFTYTNIFETKALEYLIVVFFFALLVPFWMLINKKRNKTAGLSAVSMEFAVGSQKLPHGIYFSRFHTWAYLKKNGVAKVGMSDLLVHLTGEVQITSFMSPGQEIIKGETLAQLHFNGKSLRLASPVSGIICQVNKLLSESPELIKDDPYQHGWIYSLKPTNWKMDASACFLAEDADAWAKHELVRVKDFLAVSSIKNMPGLKDIVLQDGGEIIENALSHFPKEVWDEFQEKFLT